MAPDLVSMLKHHGQAIDPNLVALADAWQEAERHLQASLTVRLTQLAHCIERPLLGCLRLRLSALRRMLQATGQPAPAAMTADEPAGSDSDEEEGDHGPTAGHEHVRLLAEDLHEGLSGGQSTRREGKPTGSKASRRAAAAAASPAAAGGIRQDPENAADENLQSRGSACSSDFETAYQQLLAGSFAVEMSGPGGDAGTAPAQETSSDKRKRRKALTKGDQAIDAEALAVAAVAASEGRSPAKSLRLSGLAVATAAAFSRLVGASGRLMGQQSSDTPAHDAQATATEPAPRRSAAGSGKKKAAKQPATDAGMRQQRQRKPVKERPQALAASRVQQDRSDDSGDDGKGSGPARELHVVWSIAPACTLLLAGPPRLATIRVWSKPAADVPCSPACAGSGRAGIAPPGLMGRLKARGRKALPGRLRKKLNQRKAPGSGT